MPLLTDRLQSIDAWTARNEQTLQEMKMLNDQILEQQCTQNQQLLQLFSSGSLTLWLETSQQQALLMLPTITIVHGL